MTNSTQNKKLLVLGATGGTGRLIARRASATGYDITALVRSPEERAGVLRAPSWPSAMPRDEATLRQALKG